MKRLQLFIFVLFLFLNGIIQAQTTKEELFGNIELAGGIYKTYSYSTIPLTQAPKGYTPFYISHYGRHGSRWLDSSHYYEHPASILEEAHRSANLTLTGENLYAKVRQMAEDARDRYGALTHRGTDEHKKIAERMFHSFPEVFSTRNRQKCFIYSRSTTVPRCIVSMAANNERLKEQNPDIEIFREATSRNSYLNKQNPNRTVIRDSLNVLFCDFFSRHFDPERFFNVAFKDPAYAKAQIPDHLTFFTELYSLAADVQDTDHPEYSIWDILTKDEIFSLWQLANLRMYYNCGPSVLNGKESEESAKDLLRDILDCADKAIADKNISADLRFGHDVYIIPLLALMDIEEMNVREPNPEEVYKVWSDFKVSPMGVNLQLVFYQNKKGNDILVKFLHCEKEVEIPVATDMAPYYHWKDVEAYYRQKLDFSTQKKD